MITLGLMTWNYMFSYGPENEIDFSKNNLTQIIAENGSGKSSIGLILEEILYNKNSKGIKKSDVLNRFANVKSYSATLEFTKESDEYLVSISRTSASGTITLLKNGVDISQHTATATYKLLESIIVYDHKTFSQLIYQSSANSLEFLTTTDSNRKKFLIDLLSLDKYTEPLDKVKSDIKAIEIVLSEKSGRIIEIDKWLATYKNFDFTEKPLVVVPESPTELETKVNNLSTTLASIETINKRIVTNNKYRELLKSIKLNTVGPKPNNTLSAKANTDIAEANLKIKQAKQVIAHFDSLGEHCPTCKQTVNTTIVHDLVHKNQSIIAEAERVVKYSTIHLLAEKELLDNWNKLATENEKYEQYHSLYDPTLETEIHDKASIVNQIAELKAEIENINASRNKAIKTNNEVHAHNAKIQVISEQLVEMTTKREKLLKEIAEANKELSVLSVLQKTFSPSGLVAYKVECLIKDLEQTINVYLQELSGGRFQLLFKISASDKLNVIVNDNGIDVDINSLSNGELARVNTSALLGIRKLLESISNSRINLLFLDETIDNIDISGKEKLVEVLVEEELLNTIIVSHGFTHPLISKIHVNKKNNISRIEYGG